MKITLFWPLQAYYSKNLPPNLSIAYLAKVLEEEGFEVTCIDANLFFYKKWGLQKVTNKKRVIKRFVKLVEKTKPDMLGVGGWSHHTPFIAEFIKEFKKRDPDLFTVLGGWNPTLVPNKILDLIPSADCLVRGQGEETFLELVKKFSKNENWRKIPGISFKNNNKITNNPIEPPKKSLEDLPLIDFENFLYFKPEAIYIMTSRSCPYNCSFCSVHSIFKHYQTLSPQRVIEQIKHLKDLYGIKAISFEDDDFLANRKRARKIARLLIKENINIYTAGAARIDEVDRETVRILKKSGLEELNFGIEHVVPKVLKFLNKSINPNKYVDRISKALDILDEEGIRFGIFLITGTPVETKKEMKMLYKFSKWVSKKAKRIEISHVKVMPGSPLWKKYEEKEIKLFKAFEPHFTFDEQYTHLPWAVPDIYMIESPHFSKKGLVEKVNELERKIHSLK